MMFKQARSIQFVWFLPGEPPTALKLFESLIGGEPDGFQKVGPPQAPLPVTVQHVIKNDLVHKIQSHTGRIDYFIEPATAGSEIPSFENVHDLLRETLARVSDFGQVVGSIARAAVVLNLAKPVGSLDDFGVFFTRLFGDKIDMAGGRDLSFQISKRLSGSSVGDVNRLLRWSAESVSFMPFVSNLIPSMALTNLSEKHYLNFMIDVNTVPTNTSYAPTEQIKVFEVLTSLAADLMSVETIESVK